MWSFWHNALVTLINVIQKYKGRGLLLSYCLMQYARKLNLQQLILTPPVLVVYGSL